MAGTVPEQVAGYRVIRQIGRGGMSTVYLAEHVHLHRKVALKILDPELAANRTFRERFARESQVVAELEHPHIVPIHDAGESDGLLYLVMRYIENRDLRELIAADGPLAPARVRTLVEQLAGALEVAHAAGLVHRDIKPANVLVAVDKHGHDHFYLGDFGITKRAASGPSLTATGQVLGSVDFIAPEQIEGRPVDGRTDVYALGGLAYECLTGRVPFERDHELAVLLAHVRDEAPPPSTWRPELAPAVDAAIGRALAKDPGQRPSTAAEFADELGAALAEPSPAIDGTAADPDTAATRQVPLPVAADPPTMITVPADGEIPDDPSTEEAAAGTVVIPAQDPPPPPAGRPHEQRWIVALAALAVVLILATITVAVNAASRTPSAPARAAPSPAAAAEHEHHSGAATATATPSGTPDPAAAAAQALGAVLPPGAAGCAVTPPVDGALAALGCAVGDVAVRYENFPDAATAAAVFDTRAGAAGAEPGRCGRDARSWTQNYHRADPAVAAGRLACSQPADGAHLVWTQADLPTVLASAVLPGTGDVHHGVYDRWATDEFGPQVPSGTALPRGGCTPGEC